MYNTISFKIQFNIILSSPKSSFIFFSFDYNNYACFRFSLALYRLLLHITFDLIALIMWAIFVRSRENSSVSIVIRLMAEGLVSVFGRSKSLFFICF